MARHLHEQSGGNPRGQGPVPELANEPRAPRSDEDFPDAPETQRRSGPGGDLSQEQLDDFAARLGLTDRNTEDETDRGEQDEERSGRDDRSQRAASARDRVLGVVRTCTRVVRRPVGRVLMIIGGAASGLGSRVRFVGERVHGG